MKTILVVEDVAINRDLLTQLLEDKYSLVFAEDGVTALALAADTRPDLILMDLSLPNMDGWEVTRKLKSDKTLASIPVIALSAHAMRSHEERARECGCNDYLTKPVDENLLFEKITEYLGY